MSLLLKALKQAERQHREAAVPPSGLDIELPEQAPAASAPPTEKPDAPGQQPVGSDPLTLSPTEPAQTPYPSLDMPESAAGSTLAFADDADVYHTDDQVRPEAFPRHGAPAADDPVIDESSAPPQAAPQAHVHSTGQRQTSPDTATASSDDAVPPAPYLHSGEAGVTLSQAPGKSIRLLTLLIIGAAIGLAAWWTMTNHQIADPQPYQPIPAMTGTAPVVSEAPSSEDTGTVGATANRKPATSDTDDSPAQTPQAVVQSATATPAPKSPSATAKEQTDATPPATRPAGLTTTRSAPAIPQPRPATRATRASGAAVRFVRDSKPARSRQSLLADGYRALLNGELSKARAAYQAALRQDRNLIDGWVGLASVAAHEGNRALAITHYQRALNIDPKDASARSGLISLNGSQRDEDGESALRSLLGAADNNPVALLALGNRLAAQGRWREAQQVYFKANTAQPDRPDTLFNLAVSLEQIRQPGVAIRFYQRALNLAEQRPHQFDPDVARKRLAALRATAEN